MRRPAVPAREAGRPEFWRAAAVFAAFAVSGLFSSRVPAFLHDRLHVDDVAAVGAQIGLLFLVAVVSQLAAPARCLSGRRPAPLSLVAGVVVRTALWTRSLPLFVVGTILAGAGVGLVFRRGVPVTQRLAHPRRRADLLSTYFLTAYTGSIVPTLALGLLNQALDENLATLLLSVAVAATTLASALRRPTPAA
ncbi:hypothetical protein AB0K16_25540 [Nonomuraea jabiensis]|uniref:hypothetical protein n=1 Tax=Nonomuraea jabiensis TaxID=882448 RepID=UPI00341726B9